MSLITSLTPSPSAHFYHRMCEMIEENKLGLTFLNAGKLVAVDRDGKILFVIYLRRLDGQGSPTYGVISRPIRKLDCENKIEKFFTHNYWITEDGKHHRLEDFLKTLSSPLECLQLKYLLLFHFESNFNAERPRECHQIVITLQLNDFLRQQMIGSFGNAEIKPLS